MSLYDKSFWSAALERAVKSAAQGAILGGVGAAGFNAFDAAVWLVVLSAAFGAFVLSLLTSIGSDALTGDGPSLTNAEVTAPR